jgi:hypothetical protein
MERSGHHGRIDHAHIANPFFGQACRYELVSKLRYSSPLIPTSRASGGVLLMLGRVF